MAAVIYTHSPVNVYKIPPRKASSRGYIADDWKQCIWSGSLQVLRQIRQAGNSGNNKSDLTIELFEVDTASSAPPKVFASCPVDSSKADQAVERCADSSRCFVFRIAQGARHAWIGVQFPDRDDAFDFQSILADSNAQSRDEEVAKFRASFDAPKDYSLKEGEKISVSLKTKKEKRRDQTVESASSNQATGGGLSLLAPPSSSNSRFGRQNGGDSNNGAPSVKSDMSTGGPTSVPVINEQGAPDVDWISNSGNGSKGGDGGDHSKSGTDNSKSAMGEAKQASPTQKVVSPSAKKGVAAPPRNSAGGKSNNSVNPAGDSTPILAGDCTPKPSKGAEARGRDWSASGNAPPPGSWSPWHSDPNPWDNNNPDKEKDESKSGLSYRERHPTVPRSPPKEEAPADTEPQVQEEEVSVAATATPAAQMPHQTYAQTQQQPAQIQQQQQNQKQMTGGYQMYMDPSQTQFMQQGYDMNSRQMCYMQPMMMNMNGQQQQMQMVCMPNAQGQATSYMMPMQQNNTMQQNNMAMPMQQQNICAMPQNNMMQMQNASNVMTNVVPVNNIISQQQQQQIAQPQPQIQIPQAQPQEQAKGEDTQQNVTGENNNSSNTGVQPQQQAQAPTVLYAPADMSAKK